MFIETDKNKLVSISDNKIDSMNNILEIHGDVVDFVIDVTLGIIYSQTLPDFINGVLEDGTVFTGNSKWKGYDEAYQIEYSSPNIPNKKLCILDCNKDELGWNILEFCNMIIANNL
jgi:hypothetical protein